TFALSSGTASEKIFIWELFRTDPGSFNEEVGESSLSFLRSTRLHACSLPPCVSRQPSNFNAQLSAEFVPAHRVGSFPIDGSPPPSVADLSQEAVVPGQRG